MKELRKGLSRKGKRQLKQLDGDIKEVCGQGRIRPAGDGKWQTSGMYSTLDTYQVRGLVDMRKRELRTEQPRGGLLACKSVTLGARDAR